MASWFIIAIASISAIGIIMLAGVNLINVMGSETGQTDAIAKFNALPDLILANSWQGPDGNIYLPAPAPAGPGDIEGVASLPSWLAARGILGTSAQVIYCPFGYFGAAPNTDVFNPDGSRYGVTITTSGDRRYVSGGRPAYADAASNPDLAGFVMMPDGNSGSYSGCNTITRTGGTYRAPGMLVRPIFFSEAGEERVNLSNTRVIYVAINGSGNGDRISSPTTLSNALARWRASTWKDTRIEMSGSHGVAAAELTTAGAGYVPKPIGATLTLTGVNRNSTFITSGAEVMINFPVNLTLANVTLSANTAITVAPNHRLQTVNAAIGPVVLSPNSQALLSGTDIRNNGMTSMTSLPIFDIRSGAVLTVTGATGISNALMNNVGQIAGGGTYNIIDASLTIGGQGPRHTVQAGGTMRVISSSINIPSVGLPTVVSNGNLLLNGATISNSVNNMSSAILELGEGSRTTLTASTISVPNRISAQRSVRSSNAAFVIGDSSTTVQGCWTDVSGPPVFAMSAPVAAGSRSRVTNDDPVPPLSPSPSASEIQAFTAANEANTARNLARIRNTSDWVCSL